MNLRHKKLSEKHQPNYRLKNKHLAVKDFYGAVGRLLGAELCVAAGLAAHDVDLDEVPETGKYVLL
jgi:hypothetical protein